jgi:hypothetical protein
MMVIIIQVSLLILIFLSLIKRNAAIFTLVVTFQILIYDVLSVFSDEQISTWIRWPLKGWQELIFLFSLLYFLLSKQKIPKLTWFFFSLTILGCITGFINGNPTNQIIQGFRIYLILPLSLFLLLESGIFRKMPIVYASWLLLWFCFLSVCYSIWQNYQFKDDLCFLWFYDFVDKIHPIEAARFNYIRNNGLRATGFFISPLIQSSILGFSTLISLRFVLNYKKLLKEKLPYILITIILIYGMYLCRTRIGWVILLGGLMQWLGYLYFFRHRYYNPFILPVFFIFLTFIWLLSGLSSDPSANGRLDQYAFCMENMKFWGLGFGHLFTITLFDSLIISAVLLFGIFSIFYLSIPVGVCHLISKISISDIKENNPFDPNFLFLPIFGFSFFILYMFAFQFTTGGPVIQLFYWFAFLILVNSRKANTENSNGK